ncbi:MAG: CHASE2 domain-containing protein [Betaproteobacteria bacterium]|nr:MAG: CHASE2 domain-containing protein [Betaproteobacteria bacterium]
MIGFDVTFAESDDNAQLALINGFARTVDSLAIDNPKLSDFIQDSRAKADNDRALLNALRRSSAAVVLGYFFHMDEAAVGYKLDKADIDRRLNGISASKYPLVYSEEPADGASPFIKSYAPQGNLDLFAAAAASTGYFTIVSDPDGRVRWLPLMIQGGEDLFPPLSILCVWHYLGRPQLAVRTDAYGVEGVQMGGRALHTDR